MIDFNDADRETQDNPKGPGAAAAVYKIKNTQQITHNKIEEFANLIGCDNVIGDGVLRRYGHKLAKWYVLHDDATFAAGAYGDWRDDRQPNTWCSRKKGEMSASEWKTCQNRIERAKAEREAEQAAEYAQAALVAKETWLKCKKADFVHKYLNDKRVKAYGIGWGTVARSPASLVIPVCSANGEIVSLQSISSAGTKSFLLGGRKRGCFFKIPGNETTFICEGYATGATIHEATGATVIIAFDAGNIPPVAKHFPFAVVACDNDRYKPDKGNAGVEAGKKSGLKYVIPQFKDLSTQPTDFNDLAALEGLRAVRKQLEPFKDKEFEQEDLTGWVNEVVTKKFIINGMLKERHSLIIAGKGGLGKSAMTLEWALRLGMQKPLIGPVNVLLDRFEIPEPKRCLFLQAENDREDTIERYQKMIAYAPELQAGAENVRFLKRDGDIVITGFFFTDPDFKVKITKEILKFKADVLIIDPLVSYHEEDENDNGAMRRTLDVLTQIQHELGISVILIHHASKSSSNKDSFALRGASAIGDWVSNIIFLEEAAAKTLKLTYPKHRGCPGFAPIYLQITDGLTFEVVDKPKDKKELEDEAKQEARFDIVIEALKALGGEAESKSAIWAWIKNNYPEEKLCLNTLKGSLEIMAEKGLIFAEKGGGRNKTKIYLQRLE